MMGGRGHGRCAPPRGFHHPLRLRLKRPGPAVPAARGGGGAVGAAASSRKRGPHVPEAWLIFG